MKGPKLRKTLVSLICVVLCLATGITAFADFSRDVTVSLVVTEDMLPTPTPTPTVTLPTAKPGPVVYPVISPRPTPIGNKDIVQTGDEAQVSKAVVVIAVSLLIVLIIICYIKTKEGNSNV